MNTIKNILNPAKPQVSEHTRRSVKTMTTKEILTELHELQLLQLICRDLDPKADLSKLFNNERLLIAEYNRR